MNSATKLNLFRSRPLSLPHLPPPRAKARRQGEGPASIRVRARVYYRGLNNYQYYFGGFRIIKKNIEYNGPPNPILIIKAPIAEFRVKCGPWGVAELSLLHDTREVFKTSSEGL